VSVHYQESTKIGRYTIAIWHNEPAGENLPDTERGGTRLAFGWGYHIDICVHKERKVVAVFGNYTSKPEARAALDMAVVLIGAGRGFDWKSFEALLH